MKFLPIALCLCLIITFDCKFANGENLLNNLLGKLHDAGEKAKTDINKFSEKVKSDFDKLTHPKKKSGKNNEEGTTFTSSTSTTTARNVDGGMVFPTDEEEQVRYDRPAFPTRPAISTAAPVTASTASLTTIAPVTTTGNGTDVKGKENFAGGCLPGFLRTSDGRCMPTY